MNLSFHHILFTLLLSLSITACGGGGGGGGSGTTLDPVTPDPVTPAPVTPEQIEAIEETLIESGYGNYDDLTPDEIAAGDGNFDDLSKTEIEEIIEDIIEDTDLTETQVKEVLEELEIELPIINPVENPVLTFANNANLTNAIGIWDLSQSTGQNNTTLNPFISIGSKSIAIYKPNLSADCYDYSLHNLFAQDDNDFTLQEISTDELSIITLLNDGTSLIYEGSEYTANEEVTLGLATLCDTTNPKTVSVDISLRELSSQLKLENKSPVSIYQWQVFFDLNHSGEYDAGDVNFLLSYNSNNDSPATGNFIETDSGTPLFYVVYQDGTEAVEFITFATAEDPNPVITVVGKSTDTGSVNLNGNTLTLSFDSTTNPMIGYITESTPIKVITLLRHDADDTATFGDLNPAEDDGPWRWTSYEHRDEYPDINDADTSTSFAISGSGTVHTDNSDDQDGEASWVDIESVEVNITTTN